MENSPTPLKKLRDLKQIREEKQKSRIPFTDLQKSLSNVSLELSTIIKANHSRKDLTFEENKLELNQQQSIFGK